MANQDKPIGFRFGYTKHGGPPQISQLKTSGAAAIYQGDVVYMSSGRIAAVTAASDGTVCGVAGAFTNSTSEETKIPVYNDLRNTVFIAQVDDATVAGTSLCGPGTYYDILYTAATTVSDLSLMEINGDASTADDLIIIDKVNRPDNDWGLNVDVYCQLTVDALSYSSVVTAT